MNTKLQNSLNVIAYEIGSSLNYFEIFLLESSLRLLQQDNKLNDVSFWGSVITTASNNYYIAFGYSNGSVSNRKFFYSLDCTKWFLLPDIRDHNIRSRPEVIYQHFRGNPSRLVELSSVSVPNIVSLFLFVLGIFCLITTDSERQ